MGLEVPARALRDEHLVRCALCMSVCICLCLCVCTRRTRRGAVGCALGALPRRRWCTGWSRMHALALRSYVLDDSVAKYYGLYVICTWLGNLQSNLFFSYHLLDVMWHSKSLR